MASKDWKLPDAQHKITEEKGLDIENESIQRQWEKTIVSFIRLEDAFSDIDVYDDTEEGEIPYRQYLMRRWLFIHQDKYKNETLKDEDKKKVNELLKTKHIKEDKFMDREFHKNLTHLTHPTQDEAYLKKLQLYIIFVERPVSSLILSTGLYFLLENGGKTMADVMVKILMKGAKAIGKTAVILIIWIAHKLENK